MVKAIPKELAGHVVEIPMDQDFVNNGVACMITLIGIPIIGGTGGATPSTGDNDETPSTDANDENPSTDANDENPSTGGNDEAPFDPSNVFTGQGNVNETVISEVKVETGATVDNTSGEFDNLDNDGEVDGGRITGTINNNGTIAHATLQGAVTNNGALSNVNLEEGTAVSGGTVTGTITGSNAVITNAVIDADSISGVTIGSGCKVTQETLANNPGLDLSETLRDESGNINPDAPVVIGDDGEEYSFADILVQATNDYLADTTASKDVVSEDENGGVHLDADNLGVVQVSVYISSVRTVDEEDSISITATGELRIVEDGIEHILTPAPMDKTAIQDGLISLGISSEIFQDGLILAKFQSSGERDAVRTETSMILPATISNYNTFNSAMDIYNSKMAFRFVTFAVKDNDSGDGKEEGTGSVGFTFKITSELHQTVSILITYPDGSTQEMVPFVADTESFKAVVDQIPGLYDSRYATGGPYTYYFDAWTGSILIYSGATSELLWLGIPDFVVTNLGADAVVPAIGLVDGNGGDYNGDGKKDFYLDVNTADGPVRQILFTLDFYPGEK